MAMAYLFSVTAAVNSGGTLSTFRFSSGEGYSHPSAPGFFEPGLVQAGLITRDAVDDGRTFGVGRTGKGEIVVANPDGAWDALLTYGYGLSASLKLIDEDANYSTAIPVLSGTVEQVVGDLNTISFRFRDRQQELDEPVQPAKFAGTNSGSTGIEGTADDLKGKPKPRLWGVVKEITPAPVNTSALIYAVNFNRAGNTAAITSIDGVFDGGTTLTLDTGVGTGGNVANLAALQGASITSGKYATCLAEGLFRLGSAPARLITCNATQGGSTAADRYVGVLVDEIYQDAGVDSADITAADITQLATDAPYETGYYADSETTYRQIVNALFATIGGWGAPDILDAYRFRQLKAPSGTPALTLKRVAGEEVLEDGEIDLIDLQRLPTSDPGKGVPACKVNLNYQRVWTTQSAGELATGVSDARRAYLAEEYRRISSEDASIKDQFLRAGEINFDTLIVQAADASTEASRRLALYKVRRDYFEGTVELNAESAALDLGNVVKVQTARFGLDAGKLFVVLGITYDLLARQMKLRIWG